VPFLQLGEHPVLPRAQRASRGRRCGRGGRRRGDSGGRRAATAAAAASAASDHGDAGRRQGQPLAANRKNQSRQNPEPSTCRRGYGALEPKASTPGRQFSTTGRAGAQDVDDNRPRRPCHPRGNGAQPGTCSGAAARSSRERLYPAPPALQDVRGVRREPNWDEGDGEGPASRLQRKGNTMAAKNNALNKPVNLSPELEGVVGKGPM